MELAELKNFLGEDLKKVDEYISTSLDSDIDLLNFANKSILSHLGKQLRPIMSLLVAGLFSDKISDSAYHCAAAAELLHNATLLHDDVVDDSPTRRGEPSMMSRIGGRASVLLGDYWLVKAMDNIFCSDEYGNSVIRLFAKTLSDLAEGELLQLQKAGTCDTDINDYLRIIYSKTASLFEATAVSAAMVSGADSNQIEAVRNYAVSLGIAFQIQDDIFDYSDSDLIGKPVGIDIKEQKITLPLLGAFKSVSKDVENSIREKVKNISSHPEYASEIREFVKLQNGCSYAREQLESYINKAIDALSLFEDSVHKDWLKRLAHFISERKS